MISFEDPMIRQTLAARLKKLAKGAGEGLDLLMSEARECVYLFPEPLPEQVGTGLSRLGGDPDLAPDIEWPTGFGEQGQVVPEAPFLAQINFADLASMHLPLPVAGLLSVFIRRISDIQAAVHYENRLTSVLGLRHAVSAYVDNNTIVDVPAALRFQLGIDLPYANFDFEKEISGLASEEFSLDDLREQLEPSTAIGQLGGYSLEDGGTDMTQWAAEGETGALSDPSQWYLLLKCHLFDVNQVLLFAPRDDLAAGNFSRVKCAGLPWNL
jgi:hypothetical protein